MPLVSQSIERVHDSASAPDVVTLAEAKLFSDAIGCLKTNTPNVICQPEWVLLNLVNALVAVGFVYFGCERGADAIALEKEHDVFDFLLFLPAFFNLVYTFFPYSVDFKQPVGRIFNHRDRIGAKFGDNSFGKLRPNAFNQAAAKIFFYTIDGGWHNLFPSLCTELAAIFGINFPVSLN